MKRFSGFILFFSSIITPIVSGPIDVYLRFNVPEENRPLPTSPSEMPPMRLALMRVEIRENKECNSLKESGVSSHGQGVLRFLKRGLEDILWNCRQGNSFLCDVEMEADTKRQGGNIIWKAKKNGWLDRLCSSLQQFKKDWEREDFLLTVFDAPYFVEPDIKKHPVGRILLEKRSSWGRSLYTIYERADSPPRQLDPVRWTPTAFVASNPNDDALIHVYFCASHLPEDPAQKQQNKIPDLPACSSHIQNWKRATRPAALDLSGSNRCKKHPPSPLKLLK